MSVTLTIFGVLAVLVIGFGGYVASKPDAFRIERSIEIQAVPEVLFAKVNDLREFNRWNPFALADASTRLQYQGPTGGVGSSYTWEGAKSGSGTMTIVESKQPAEIVMQLEFRKPYVASNRAVFSFDSSGSQTKVIWSMTGHYSFAQKLFATLFNMDKMVGGEFAKGLSTLKSQTER